MIILNTSSRSLEIDLAGAVTTNQLQCIVSYEHKTQSGISSWNTNQTLTNNTTAVTLLDAPPAGARRNIISLTIYNADTVNATVTIQLNDNGTLRIFVASTLSSGDTLIYNTGQGWYVINSSGTIKSAGSANAFNDLSDVVITSPANNAGVHYDGTNWIDNVTSDTTVGPIEIAVQSEQETGTSTILAVTPGRQQYHPSAAKAWVKFNSAGTVAASYNITSVTDNGTGDWTVNIATDFSSANYCGVGLCGRASTATAGIDFCLKSAAAAGTFNIFLADGAGGGTPRDPDSPDEIYVVFFGDQA